VYYVYVIKSGAGEIYYGFTSDLKKRLAQDKRGENISTKGCEWTLVYYETFKCEGDARERECQLKRHGQAKRWLRERIERSLEV
jgi:predicted GIY-YIG superfamily endonuclease